MVMRRKGEDGRAQLIANAQERTPDPKPIVIELLIRA